MKRRFFIALLAVSSLLTTNVWANPIVTPSKLEHNHIHVTDASLFSVRDGEVVCSCGGTSDQVYYEQIQVGYQYITVMRCGACHKILN